MDSTFILSEDDTVFSFDTSVISPIHSVVTKDIKSLSLAFKIDMYEVSDSTVDDLDQIVAGVFPALKDLCQIVDKHQTPKCNKQTSISGGDSHCSRHHRLSLVRT